MATQKKKRKATPEVVRELSRDWYWEQDASLHFTRVDAHGAAEQALATTIVGKKRWETGIEVEGGWEAHRAVLEARAPFRDVLMWRRLDDGSRRYFTVSGDPITDDKGRFCGYRGIGRDITKQKRMQQLLKLQHAVTRRLGDAAGVAEALSGALQAICDAEGWDCAEFWKFSAGELRPFVQWSRPGDPQAQRFIDASRDLAIKPGAGLVGTVWQTGEVMWLADSTDDPRGLRKALAERTGLRGAALLPVRYGGGSGGVLNFHSRRIRPPDKRLAQALNAIVTQLGQFLQRVEAEQATHESEARFRSLTNLSSDWYWEQDAEYRLTRLEGRLVAGGDDALRQRLMGTRRWESGLQLEGSWDAHRALLDARKPFYDLLMWRTLADGGKRYISVSGEPVYATDGRFTGYRGVGRDLTEQKRDERMLQLEHQVARSLAAADSAPSGLKAVIKALCKTESWACGRYFRVDEAAQRLEFQYGWAIDDPAFEQFIERSRGLSFAPGQGISAAVWQSGEPLWTADVLSDARVVSRALYEGTGVHSVFIMPVVSENKTIGVLNFASPGVRPPDRRLLQASRVIGSQIGQFVHRKQAEESLRESEARFRSLTQMSSDFFWETDEAHRLAQLVHGPNYSSAYMNRGVLGKAVWEIPALSPDEAGWTAHRAVLDEHLAFRDFEFARAMPDGVVRHFSISGEPRFAGDGQFLGHRGVGRDITDVALARERIASLAYSDPLTGLANRTSLGPSLEQAVQRARRKNAKLAVVFLDLDGFKLINDVHGHDAGDALLIELAARLRTHLRASDLIARLGGDEFLVVLEEVVDTAPVEKVAGKLLAEVERPYTLAGREARVTASIGISVFPDDAADSLALMKHADMAMYVAKQAGKNTFHFYTAGAAANEPKSEPGVASA